MSSRPLSIIFYRPPERFNCIEDIILLDSTLLPILIKYIKEINYIKSENLKPLSDVEIEYNLTLLQCYLDSSLYMHGNDKLQYNYLTNFYSLLFFDKLDISLINYTNIQDVIKEINIWSYKQLENIFNSFKNSSFLRCKNNKLYICIFLI
jgi:hypothetical protein